ncbi:VOC family protein [Conexibacter sp. DBS9H8]|uniref:VOC family protein n=1 Tax=Conexibacter sp. DBS9H8 TaxID=2937801 RepID=UPI00200DCC40|nr:VOC family protein [Conexibacter sp. DBS9H8]
MITESHTIDPDLWREPREPELAELAISDPPGAWRQLGFLVDEEGNLDLGGVRLRLGSKGSGGILSWSLRRVNAMGSIDGLPTPVPRMLRPPPFSTHPNGATGLDHLVITTPNFDRTAAALARAGLPLKRTQEIGRGRQGFRRVGPAILELVQLPADGAGAERAGVVARAQPSGPPGGGAGDPRFWGLVVVVISLEALAEQLGDRLGEIRPAVQPGRRIAALTGVSEIAPALAFMTPEPR